MTVNAEISEHNRRIEQMLKRLCGTAMLDALDDPKTSEVMLNPDGKLWVERFGSPMTQIGTITPSEAQSILETVAGYHALEITQANPVLECVWPLDGSRFEGLLPPIVQNAAFSLRKRAVAIFTLDEYVSSNVMTEDQRATIVKAVTEKKNILVIGGTSTGKTTLVNAILREMTDQNEFERIITIEDTAELQVNAQNFTSLYTSFSVTMTRLLIATLRLRPDRICVGETRGPEALDLLMAWNTGHPGGCATLHANSAMDGLKRLSTLVSMNPFAPRIIEPLIGSAVDIVVFIARTKQGRRVEQILEVKEFDERTGIFNTKII